MITLDEFTPAAQAAIVTAGQHAARQRRLVLGPEFLLSGLAAGGPLTGGPGGVAVSPAAVHAEIARRWPGLAASGDDGLLAALGIDAGEVRRRALRATGIRPGDPALWTLHRSRLRPLRLTLDGPAVHLRLDEGSRKAVEVAAWIRRRGGRPRAGREDLLWGLLSDGASPAVRILRRLGVDVPALGADLTGWHTRARLDRPA